MSEQKPIKIYNFHAYEWCGHCKEFRPVWEQLIAAKDSEKNIEFLDYDEADIGALPEDVRTVDGKDVRLFGYPAIKITVLGKNYMYLGKRTPENIYGFIIDVIKNPLKFSVKDEDNTDIASSSKELDDALNETRDAIFKSQTKPKQMKGGNLKTIDRKITDDDFKFVV